MENNSQLVDEKKNKVDIAGILATQVAEAEVKKPDPVRNKELTLF